MFTVTSGRERVMRDRRHVVPDTNVLLRVLRDAPAAAAFQGFVRRRARWLAMAAPVEMELRAGARTPAASAVTDQLMRAVARDDRRFVPSAQAYGEAGRVLAALGGREGLDVSRARGSFTADVLIAVTCREHDAILVTENAADFARIQRHLRGFRYTTAWPM
jgi:predicted nucleic acid-binding protein